MMTKIPRANHLMRMRKDTLKRIALSEEKIEWLSDANIVMTRREGTAPPEDLKALLLAEHRRNVAYGKRTIEMIDEMIELWERH